MGWVGEESLHFASRYILETLNYVHCSFAHKLPLAPCCLWDNTATHCSLVDVSRISLSLPSSFPSFLFPVWNSHDCLLMPANCRYLLGSRDLTMKEADPEFPPSNPIPSYLRQL